MSGFPNWAGNGQAEAGATDTVAGDLYILPITPSIETNPSIGLEERNIVALPTNYKDMSVKNLSFETINPPYPIGAQMWSKYPAIDDVVATRTEAPFNLRQWDIKDFKDVDGSSFHAVREGVPIATGGQITADLGVSAPIGAFALLSASSACQVDGSMVVNGPTTLDGGTIHGTSIGSLPIEGINSVRIDVLPIGIDIVSPTYITIDAAGAGNFACGGALSFAGGSYIEYNTDQNYFINSSAGNDYTDILVGNIHPAFEGTDNLRINGGGSGRGVYLDDGVMVHSKIHRTPQFSYFKVSWSATTYYSESEEVDYEGVCYISQIPNKNFPPGSSYQPWDIDTSYVVGNLVFVLLNTFRCISDITGGDGPGTDTDHWEAVGIITDEVWLANGEKFADNQVSFKKEPIDGYEWSFIKLKNSEGLRVMRKLIDVNTQVIGRLYDDTLYPPTIGTLPVSGDLNMNLYSVLNAQKIQPSQLDIGTDWVDDAIYNSGDYVVAGSSVYLCITNNLNLNPTGTIPEWSNDGVEYSAENIVQYDGKTYGCILAYTSMGEDNAPDGDTDHWQEQFIFVSMENYWAFQRTALNGGVEFPALLGDMKYYGLVKPFGSAYKSLWIIERNAGTGELSNAGMIYDTGINVPVIGGDNSLTVAGDLDMDAKNITNIGIVATDMISSATGSSVVFNSNLDMALYNITNVNDLAITQLMAVSGGPGYVFVRDQLEGDGKSIQNFNLLGLIGPATGDDATLQLKTTADSVGLEAKVDADTGEASITANMGVPLTITTNGELILYGSGGISANTLSMTGNIQMGSNDINACDNIDANSINSIANLFRRGNFANFQDQTFIAGSTDEQQIVINSTLGTTNGVSLDTSTYEISVDTDGSYKVDMTYQLNSSGGTHTHTYFWVKNNGTAIANSTQQKTARNNEVQCVSYSRIFQLESGDKLTFWWNSSNANDYLYYDAGISTPYERPEQPSVAISVVSV